MSRLRQFKPRPRHGAKRAPGWQQEIVIERLADDGRGVGKRDGKVVFVDRALPGERVLAQSYRCAKRFDEASIRELITPSPERSEPLCEHYADCGGCQLQHLEEQGQHAFKVRRFAALMRRLDGPDAMPPLLSPVTGYRHRLRLAFSPGVVGLRSPRSHDVVPVPHCQIVSEPLRAALGRLEQALPELSILHRGELELAAGEGGEVACELQLAKRPSAAAVERFVSQFPFLISAIRHKDEVIYRCSSELVYPLTRLRFEPGDFTQVNPQVNAAILQQVADWLQLEAADYLLDAFSGLGNFSFHLADRGAASIGLESDAAMVERAQARARELGLKRVEFANRDLFAEPVSFPKGLTKAVIDPPRAGAQALCQALVSSSIRELVYVSCDPATLERDAAALLAGGFRIEAGLWAEMFPQSHHMECLLWLRRSVV